MFVETYNMAVIQLFTDRLINDYRLLQLNSRSHQYAHNKDRVKPGAHLEGNKR